MSKRIILLALLACLMAVLFGLHWREQPVVNVPKQEDPPVRDMCVRQSVYDQCVRNSPTLESACSNEADRQAWRPTSQVKPECRA